MALRLAELTAGIERITLQVLINNAKCVKVRKMGKGYSPSRYRNLTTLLQKTRTPVEPTGPKW